MLIHIYVGLWIIYLLISIWTYLSRRCSLVLEMLPQEGLLPEPVGPSSWLCILTGRSVGADGGRFELDWILGETLALVGFGSVWKPGN